MVGEKPLAYFPVRHWNTGAAEWDKTVENRDYPHYFYYYEADLYIDDLLKKARVALELGAGTCGSTVKHTSKDLRVVALDYSPAMLKLGKIKVSTAGLYEHVDLVVADQCHLPFRNECFDAVFSRGVALSYASKPEAFAHEAFRVLREGCPVGIDFINGTLAKKVKRKIYRFERIDGNLYYVEQFNEDGKQKRVGYRLPDDFQLPQTIQEGSGFGGLSSRPDWLKLEGLERKDWWALFYTPPEARKLFKPAGFRTIKLFPLGCFTYGVRDARLYDFLRDNRDCICKLQKELSKVFRLETGVHIFLSGVKPRKQ